MALLFLTGKNFNSVGRAEVAPTASPTAGSGTLSSYLGDGFVSRPMIFGAVTSPNRLTQSLNMLVNPSFETNASGDPANWSDVSTAPGSMDRFTSAPSPPDGSAVMRVQSGAGGVGRGQQRIVVRAGERLNITARLRAPAGTVGIQVQNAETGNYLTSGAAWQASATSVFTRNADSWATSGPLAFTVESLATMRTHTTELIVTGLNTTTSSATGYIDLLKIWPSTSWVSVHGHRIRANQTVELRRSTDNFSGSNVLEATLTARRPSFYAALGSIRDDEYWRLEITGTPDSVVYIGEWVLGQYKTLAKNQKWEEYLETLRAQIRDESPVGVSRVYDLATDSVRKWGGQFRFESATQRDDFRDNFYAASHHGFYPTVIAPDSSDPEVCIYGTLGMAWRQDRVGAATGLVADVADVEVMERAFPTVTV